MLKIEAEPMRTTLNLIPRTVPSNKQTFMELKARERKHESNTIQKENMKIIDKLENVHSDYDTMTLNHGWRDNLRYRDILVKKGSLLPIQSQSQITINWHDSIKKSRNRG